MKETFLKVLTVSAPTEGKGNVPYKTVTFQGINIIGNREANVKGTVVRNFWPARYERELNGVMTTFRGDAEYDTIAAGDIYAGSVFTCETLPYKITEDGQFIRTWKGVVFEGENALVIAARALRQNGSKPLHEDETGKMVPFVLPEAQPVTKVKVTENEPS